MGKFAKLFRRHGWRGLWALALFLAACVTLAAPATTQAQDSNASSTGCEGGDFDDGCSALELFENGGRFTIDFPNEGLRVVVDQFNLDQSVFGASPPDFGSIQVFGFSSRGEVVVVFEDKGPDEWFVLGGGEALPNSMTVKIRYRVRVFDLQTNESVERLGGTAVAVGFGTIGTVDPNADPPAQASMHETLEGGGGDAIGGDGLKVVRVSSAQDDPNFDMVEFDPQSELVVRKTLDLQPGREEGSVAEINSFLQRHRFSSDDSEDEVGCAPGMGEQGPLEFCSVPAGNRVSAPPNVLGDETGFAIEELPPDPANPMVRHVGLIKTEDGTSFVGLVTDVGQRFPLDGGNSQIRYDGFDQNCRNWLMVGVTQFDQDLRPLPTVFNLLDTITGEAARPVEDGEVVFVGGQDREIARIFSEAITCPAKAVADVDLLIPGNQFPLSAIVVKAISEIFEGGGAPVFHVVLPGDTVETDQGPLRLLTNLVETAAVNKLTNTLLIRGTGFGFPADRNLVVVEDAGTGPARLVASSGDAVGGDEVISLALSGSVNGQGDAAYLALTGPAGSAFPTGSAAQVSPATGGSLTVVKTDDPIPDIAGAQAGNIQEIGINDSRQGAVSLFYQSGAQFELALLGFDYDDGSVTDVAPLLTTQDMVTGPDGVSRRPVFLQLDPRGVGEDSVAVAVSFDDGTSAVLFIPLDAAAPTVPDVVGLARADAEAAVVAAGLTVGTVSTANSDAVPAGDVISQDPAAGTEAAEGDPVNLVVSDGPAASAEGDIDGDGDVDRDDISLILEARNQPVDGPDDPRDLDGDGVITVLDARLVAISCTRSRCAVQ